jgi:DNA-binding beta-propeller fold protein YncE
MRSVRNDLGPHDRWRRIAALIFAAFTGAAQAEGTPTSPVSPLFDIRQGSDGALSLPSDVAVGDNGRIYVVDSGHHRIAVFDRSGKSLFSVGKLGSASGEFRNPVGIGAGAKGTFFVADKDNHRIQIFGADGHWQRSIAVKLKGKPAAPIDVAADRQGRLYVTTNNHAVVEYDTRGKLLRQWGGEGSNPGEFRFPACVSVDPQGVIYVVDILNARVQSFDWRGRFIVPIGEWGVLPGQFFRPKGIATDSRGRIYVADSYMDVIQVFDSSRRFLHVLGQGGKPQRFVSATGIDVDQSGRLYVAEMLLNRISVYDLRP